MNPIPPQAAALLDAGAVLTRQGRLPEALPLFRQAVALAPAWPQAHLNLGLALLALGDWREGWEEFEWRRRHVDLNAFAGGGLPDWDGLPQPEGGVLISTEQGFGDTLQCARLLPWAARLAGRLTVAVRDPLLTLFQDSFGAAMIIAGEGAPLPRPAAHLPLMSLPRLFGLTPASVPTAIPYFQVPPMRAEKWRRRLSRLPGRKLGLCWASAGTGADALRKSLAPADLAPLAALPGITWLGLHKGAAAGDCAALPLSILDLGPELVDFAETAAVLGALDGLVTVDTAIMHLAGGLGLRCWTLLQFAPDWRWSVPEAVWYPGLAAFPQTAPGRWNEAVFALVRTLAENLRRQELP